MKSTVVFLGLFALIASSGNFLRNLAAPEITVSAITYKDDACTTIKSGYKFELTASDTSGSAAIAAKVTTNIVKLAKSSDSTSTIATTCDVEANSSPSTAFKIKCSTTEEGKVSDNYKLVAIASATALISGGDDKIIIPSTVNDVLTAKTGYNAPGNNTANSKEYDISNATFPVTFDIAMSNDMTTVPAIKAGNTTLTSVCKVDTTTKTKLTCSLAKETLKGSKTGISYKITATNVCNEDEETGVTIKVVDEDASSFLTVSKFALVIIGLFFL